MEIVSKQDLYDYLGPQIDQEVTFEDRRIMTMKYGFRTREVIETLFKKIEELQNKLKGLVIEQEKCIIYKFRKISNEQGENEIISFLKEIRKERKRVSLFEISQKLRLPADQVELIIEKLTKVKKIEFV